MKIKRIRMKITNTVWLKEQRLGLEHALKVWKHKLWEIGWCRDSQPNRYKYEAMEIQERINYYNRKLKQIDAFFGYLLEDK